MGGREYGRMGEWKDGWTWREEGREGKMVVLMERRRTGRMDINTQV